MIQIAEKEEGDHQIGHEKEEENESLLNLGSLQSDSKGKGNGKEKEKEKEEKEKEILFEGSKVLCLHQMFEIDCEEDFSLLIRLKGLLMTKML